MYLNSAFWQSIFFSLSTFPIFTKIFLHLYSFYCFFSVGKKHVMKTIFVTFVQCQTPGHTDTHCKLFLSHAEIVCVIFFFVHQTVLIDVPVASVNRLKPRLHAQCWFTLSPSFFAFSLTCSSSFLSCVLTGNNFLKKLFHFLEWLSYFRTLWHVSKLNNHTHTNTHIYPSIVIFTRINEMKRLDSFRYCFVDENDCPFC